LLVATGPLAAIIGATPMTLPDMMARLWQYVRWRRLIDPSKTDVIKANAKYRALFRGAEQATQGEIIGYVIENVRLASGLEHGPPA
jgi:chromatin remodeling complex protein RSC6